ncbi:U4/U6.U5 tri-snRNP-associated protein [Wickerhamomyces ciferrii]|uniref:U4/U6.U5 tri-snRNP-associated protein n=1 Tax=Wickerhamomyces ciferrii (strain ATCC 14091 / BCRC 22168 / CBS 111 / JCM 3599 / NBRC 0793 / NRRL Y-1031 F-60-10) TaxID=1206466 RepID=K0KMN9_WICCF|nr:U4/U6.U5 tri-snRNP-associated protein [Wickerhamomyces ciferrii]CCH44221.1 U4/U6.U5 tri-snRNP-associated protein [Wickerhamomyces ciferrii]
MSDSEEPVPKRSKPQLSEDIYLDTIDRKKLDFDFEKICSVSLNNINIYGCLTCGKYFQGRSPNSVAFNHSILENHHVFINFNNFKVYILPENYEVKSNSLNDIKYQILPSYTQEDLKKFNDPGFKARDLNGNEYVPGYVGLNNMKNNDYSNVILQSISHVSLIRDKLLLSSLDSYKDELNKRFIILVKKLWSSKLFKNHISPHELLQYISILSNKSFGINEQKDPKDFLIWFLNTLNKTFKSDNDSILSKAIQGKILIQNQKPGSKEFKDITTKFWLLNLELPTVPFLKDSKGIQQIQQVKLSKLLDVYKTQEEQLLSNGEIRKYKILKLPKFLILNFNRFKDQKLDLKLSLKERNQTLVEFPLEMEFLGFKYKLISNVINQVETNQDHDKNQWKVQLRHHDNWFEIEDLYVKTKEKEFLFLSETYIQIWERI